MAKIAIIGCGNTGQILCESLQDKMPEATFMVVNHFAKGETSAVPHRINTRLKRTLTDDERIQFETDISKLTHLEQPGDSYWWYASKHGMPDYPHMLYRGIALVRDEVIVACARTSVLVSSFARYTQNPMERWTGNAISI